MSRVTMLSLLWLLPLPAAAATLQVGEGKLYALPSDAAAAAQDGDHIVIAPGTYFDCAFWKANGLLIEGASAERTIVTDKACGGKALFVIDGAGITIRNLTLARARVADANGAGIRDEARDLTVEDVRFENNQMGLLGGVPGGHVVLRRCLFTANGVSLDGRATHAVSVSGFETLRVEQSRFEHARGGDHIAASGMRTELVGNRFADEGGQMRGPLVMLSGGALLLEGNTVELAAAAVERPGAVLAVGSAADITVRGNTLHEAPGAGVPLLRNWTGAAVAEQDNTVPGDAAAVSQSGATYHRLRAEAARVRDTLTWAAGKARHVLAVLLH
jgi:hypothetical protein